MKIDFTGKTVLITGASRGIGRETAIKFADCGARIVIHYNHNANEALKTHSLLHHDNHIIQRADLSDISQIDSFCEKIIRKTGKIDILVNNAGIYKECNMLESNFTDWQKHVDDILKVNLFAPAHLMHFFGKHMAKKGGGKIINVSSRGAFRGEPLAPAYGSSKAALNQLSQSLACLLAPSHVFVYVVAPGFVETDMSKNALKGEKGMEIKKQSPLNRIAKPEEVAHAILLLASDNTDFMTGAILDVNGASYLRS
ncbi:MAG: SDR family NAD(P)-dependent oxidoreductase [Bacteroidales bacterium]|jgi:NAD(P)-dependent dehydrogenase (short-subunit alcohol dehydrogenase family)|nr:SDR family oxidoreductase [Bacteroidales bacterium]MDD4213863.1 SDR family NAD(P)-dependent oxidoreductase [Bacteroidales bacterium]